MKEYISADEGLKIILDNVNLLSTEKVFLLEALGRVIAEDIVSPYNVPIADNSAMDGYAIRAEDTVGATEENPVKLKIVEIIPAGKVGKKILEKNEACKIMTGAPLPEGADAVARKEICVEKNGYVYIYEEVKRGKDVRYAGEDIKKGELAIRNGTVVTPAVCGVLSALGKSVIKVYKRPVVAILITGDEIVDIDESIEFGKVKNSNAYSLMALIKEAGGIPIYTGIVKDDRESLKKAILDNLNADVILSTGGVSVGDYDYTKEVVKKAGFDIKFWKLRIKPGKPLMFATKDDKLYFGIPGNPVSTMVVFYNFIKPALLKMQGFENIFLPEREAILAEDIRKKDSRREFIRGILFKKDGNLYVKSKGPQGSGILKSMAMGNCFIIMKEDITYLNKGSKVKVYIYKNISF